MFKKIIYFSISIKRKPKNVFMSDLMAVRRKCLRRNACTQKIFKKDEHKGRGLVYHLVQSFKDFETTPEVAHKYGLNLVEGLYADNSEVVIATCLDQDHLHNQTLPKSV